MSHSLILSLSMVCHIAPCVYSIHCSHLDCSQLNPDEKLITARSNLKSKPQRPARQHRRHYHRLLSSHTKDIHCHLVSSFGTFHHRDADSFEVESYRGELHTSCIFAFIRSEGDRRETLAGGDSATRKKLLEDMKSFQRNKDDSPFSCLSLIFSD